MNTKDKALRLELVIECHDASVASALDAVLMPDNRYFPKDQKFEASKRGRLVTYKVASPRTRPALSTAASIIADSRLFRDVWEFSKAAGRAPGSGRRPNC